MLVDQTISVLERAIDHPDRPLAPAAAREILQWRLSDSDNRRMDQLIAKSRSVGLTPEETEAFNELCVAVDFLSILHVHAREALGEFKTPGI